LVNRRTVNARAAELFPARFEPQNAFFAAKRTLKMPLNILRSRKLTMMALVIGAEAAAFPENSASKSRAYHR
jgi:hypothetical protein